MLDFILSPFQDDWLTISPEYWLACTTLDEDNRIRSFDSKLRWSLFFWPSHGYSFFPQNTA